MNSQNDPLKPDATILAPQAASIIVAPPTPTPIAASEKMTLPPKTTEQEDLTTAGQRRINMIWEFTQAFIAIVVVSSTMSVGVMQGFQGKDVALPGILGVAFGMVCGSYFQRTNHVKIGGVGTKPYEGR